ncbi:MAG: MFS transporter [Armatimonadetes bacterium]|nr:MFS transporter [Armatimonadota bacterium]
MYRWVVEALLFLIYFAFGISWLAYSPLMGDLEKHFSVSHAQAGMLISLVSISKAFVPLLAGLLAARIGLRYALLVGAGLSALAALAPLAPNFDTLLAVRVIFGIGGAIVVTLMGPMVMSWFPRNELPMVNGLNNVAVNSGITFAMFSTVGLAGNFGWQPTLVAFGAVSGLLALAWAIFGRNAGDEAAAKKAVGERATLGEVCARRETWLIALAFSGPLSLYLALNTWLPTHYQLAFGLSKQAASQLTGLFNLVGIPVAVMAGWVTGRLGLRRPLIVLAGLLMPISAFGLFGSPDATVRVVSAVFLGASFFLYVSPLFTIPMELEGMTPSRVALMMGVVFSVAYVVSFLSPLVVGWLKDNTGSFTAGLGVFAVLSASLAVGGLLLPETGPARAVRLEAVPAR